MMVHAIHGLEIDENKLHQKHANAIDAAWVQIQFLKTQMFPPRFAH